ncbi:hypothetical protein DFQ28_006892 [Apophysomyces sp. BC1034]|nr:hypothetical protein DFQ30_000031 [Apophysomyces sp. BC1015]KAG0181974.1 hypothetical protein DFQ29_006233 [Apophysomyces sp. BC1021]KAG0193008.1 hypothetical protein DFQ28_006892 [Apophysomyces sp. BC1034]
MKACICVDYLSHDWKANELTEAYHEIRKQLLNNKAKLSLNHDLKQQRKLRLERINLVRYENTLWRQMARTCTAHLSRQNQMIDPSSVNWQKESDITWLYGPLYQNEFHTQPVSISSPSGLKPVLRKNTTINTRQLHLHQLRQELILPTSLHESCDSFEKPHYRPWSKCVSDPGIASSPGVRFNPEVVQFKYFPESPVRDSISMENSEIPCWLDKENEENEEEREDETLWALFVDVSLFVKKTSRIYLDQAAQRLEPNRAVSKDALQFGNTMTVLTAFVSTVRTVASLTATWLMYQSLAPLFWAAHRTFRGRSTKLQLQPKEHIPSDKKTAAMC